MDVSIRSDQIECVVSTAGGAIWLLDARLDDATTVPLLRPTPFGAGRDAQQSGCFPFVPFGNRVAGNRFEFDGKAYVLAPNTVGDPHYLHGDAWLGEWTVRSHDGKRLEIGFDQRGEIYSYAANQMFTAEGRKLTMRLSVENRSKQALPFGLGWHPFFPLTPMTTLEARAASYWTERAGWLPDAKIPVPADLDFSSPRRVPRHWVNNGFEDWNGKAAISWPERGIGLTISTDPALTRYFVFVSDASFDPSYAGDFFCFEPMTHSANGHNLVDLGGLVVLQPGESLSISMRLAWSDLGGAPETR